MKSVHRLKGEGGQAMVFGALTLFCLVSFAAATFNVGQVSAHRIEMQNAADQAALAGAWVEADVLSEIGWINEGMAYVYYNLMRYSVDTAVYGVLAELKEHGPPYPSDALVGVTDPVNTYEDSYARSQEWIERGETWIAHLEKLEAGIAIAAPDLIRQEIFRVALAHGAQKVAIFPDLTFYPGQGNQLTLVITKTASGWALAADNGYSATVEMIGPDSYRVTSSTSGSFTVVRNSPDQYTITDSQGRDTVVTRTPAGWVISGPGGDFTVAPGPNGGSSITHNGKTEEFRRDGNGNLQRWNGGTWEDMGGGTMTIDGTPVPISQGEIVIDGVRITLEPLAIGIDNLRITFGSGNNLVIEGAVGPAWLRIDDDAIVVNGLSSASADNRWRKWGGDRSRHRMKADSATQWTYQLTVEGTILQEEPNRTRFGIEHAVKGYAPPSDLTGTLPAWVADASSTTGWFDPRIGTLSNPASYHQTRLCWFCAGSGMGGTCPLCSGVDNDGDGRTDVRKYAFDATGRHDPSYQSVEVPKPYVLTDVFFRFGINVGVWREKAQPMLAFPEPAWGTFAFACAKAGFLQDESADRYTYGFSVLADRDDWVENDNRNLYGQDWQKGSWEARLVPVRFAIRSDDIQADQSLEEATGRNVDSGANYLLRGFLETAWLESADDRNEARHVNGKLSSMLSKDGMAFDPTDTQLLDVMRH